MIGSGRDGVPGATCVSTRECACRVRRERACRNGERWCRRRARACASAWTARARRGAPRSMATEQGPPRERRPTPPRVDRRACAKIAELRLDFGLPRLVLVYHQQPRRNTFNGFSLPPCPALASHALGGAARDGREAESYRGSLLVYAVGTVRCGTPWVRCLSVVWGRGVPASRPSVCVLGGACGRARPQPIQCDLCERPCIHTRGGTTVRERTDQGAELCSVR